MPGALAGQGDNAPSVSSDDSLMAFLLDNPGADASHEHLTDPLLDSNEPADDAGDDNSLTHQGTRNRIATADDLPPGDELDPHPTRGDKPAANARDGQGEEMFEVRVKGDDGAETALQVSRKELLEGYIRRADHTRRLQEFSTQRAQVISVADARIEKSLGEAMEVVQRAQATIIRLAALKAPAELASLANTNPQAYNAERARTDAVLAEIQALDREHDTLKAKQAAAEDENLKKAFTACWEVLNAEGITGDTLRKVFADVQREYGIPAERFQKINDPKLILMMKDAAELRDLKKRAAELQKQ